MLSREVHQIKQPQFSLCLRPQRPEVTANLKPVIQLPRSQTHNTEQAVRVLVKPEPCLNSHTGLNMELDVNPMNYQYVHF